MGDEMKLMIDREMLRIIQPYHELWYIWPWRRKRGEAWFISLDGAGMAWASIDEERRFWREYCMAYGSTEAEALEMYPPLPRWARLLERLLQ